MKNTKLRALLAAFSLFSILWMTTVSKAAPVRFSQVVQIVNAKPGKANTGGFTQLRLVGDDNLVTNQTTAGDNDPKPSSTPPPPQDGRVIVETRSDIVEEEACDCNQPPPPGGFPKYALLGLAAIPFLFLIPPGRRRTPTPTPPTTQTPPPETPTPPSTPPETPTPPPMTPTPEPVPEPITILLFGTGLAGIGVAARKRFRRKNEDETED